MFKRIIVSIVLLGLFFPSLAQNLPTISKPRLYIEEFTHSGGYSRDCEALRATVISAINSTDRFDMLNTDSQEVAMGSGNNYILKGHLLTYTVNSKVVDGKTLYSCGFKYTITIVDASKLTDIYSHTYAYGEASDSLFGGLGSYSSEQDLINAVSNKVKKEMIKMVIEQLPLKGEIIGEDIEVKGDKLKACYINIGCGLGVKVGDLFSILIPQVRAGRTVYKPVGKLKVKEIFDDDPSLSYCTVTSGEKEVYEALEEYLEAVSFNEDAKPLMVRSTISFMEKF